MDNFEIQSGVERAEFLGDNKPTSNTLWYKSGLSLITEGPIRTPDFLRDHETDFIPQAQIALGDLVVYAKGPHIPRKDNANGAQTVDTSQLQLIRFGAAYTNATDETWVISQDQNGKVWKHPIEELPQSDEKDWTSIGLRLTNQQPTYPDGSTAGVVLPAETIDFWLQRR